MGSARSLKQWLDSRDNREEALYQGVHGKRVEHNGDGAGVGAYRVEGEQAEREQAKDNS